MVLPCWKEPSSLNITFFDLRDGNPLGKSLLLDKWLIFSLLEVRKSALWGVFLASWASEALGWELV